MPKKKILLATLLLLSMVGVFLPSPKPASAEFCGGLVGAALGNPCSEGYFCSGPVAGVCLPNPLSSATSAISEAAIDAALAILKYLAFIPLFITGILDFIAGTALLWVIRISDVVSFTHNSAVNIGWPIARDFANILIVLGFIAIAVATILRFKEYEAKSLLVKLIVAALLVNFSLLICGVIIDGSNIIIRNFLSIGSDSSIGGLFDFRFFNAAVALVNSPVDAAHAVEFMAKVMGNVFYNIMSAIVLALFAFLFLFRIVALWMLVIMSPIAFICYVFPATKGVWNMWWSNFVQWCIIGIPGAFFLYIGRALMASMSTNPPVTPVLNEISAGAGVNQIFNALSPFFTMLIPGLFLIMGFLFSLQVSAMGSAVAIGWARKAGGYAKAGAGRTAKWAGNRSGITQAWERAKVSGVGALEGAGILTAGSKATADKKRKEEAIKPHEDRIDNIKDNAEVARIATSGATPEERAAAVKVLNKRGAIDAIEDKKQRETAVQAATAYVSAGELAKTDPEQARKDENKVADIKRRLKLAHPDWNEAKLQTKAEDQAVREAYARMDTSDLDKLQEVDAIAKFGNKSTSEAERSKILERAVKEGWAHRLEQEYSKEEIVEAVNTAETDYGSNVRKGYENSNPAAAADNKKTVADIQKEGGKFADEKEAKKEAVRRKVKGLTPSKAADLSEKVFDDEEYGQVIFDSLSKGQKDKIEKDGSAQLQQKIDEMKERTGNVLVKNVMADVDAIPENLTKAANSEEISDAVKNASPEIQEKLKEKFIPTAVDPETIKETTVTKEEAGAQKAKNISVLIQEKFMRSQYDDYDAALEAKNKKDEEDGYQKLPNPSEGETRPTTPQEQEKLRIEKQDPKLRDMLKKLADPKTDEQDKEKIQTFLNEVNNLPHASTEKELAAKKQVLTAASSRHEQLVKETERLQKKTSKPPKPGEPGAVREKELADLEAREKEVSEKREQMVKLENEIKALQEKLPKPEK